MLEKGAVGMHRFNWGCSFLSALGTRMSAAAAVGLGRQVGMVDANASSNRNGTTAGRITLVHVILCTFTKQESHVEYACQLHHLDCSMEGFVNAGCN